ncbi:MAG: molybdopterin-synthase adenylyltransferase MoeB [Holophagales bacterium]|nr:molybdopterin-synthase adenylyltransferase MoeB [Holophagales bacterium]
MCPSPSRSDLSLSIDARAHQLELSSTETRRYGRHLVLPEVGMDGQKRLKSARILLVGAGGLGSPAALYLAAAGVGHLGLIDFDHVDSSNLQRQVLFGESDLGRPKVEAGAERLRDLNPEIEIECHPIRLGLENVRQLVRDHDLVVDGSDNFSTRYLVNDACLLEGRPLVWGAVLRFEGQISVFGVEGGPCYRCLFPEPPPAGMVPSCAEGGVLGVLPGIIGSLQANEAIKLVLASGESLVGRFLVFDALGTSFRELKLHKNPDCPACAEDAFPELREYADLCGESTAGPTDLPEEDVSPEILPENDEQQIPFEIHVEQLRSWKEAGQPHVLLDVREPQELAICRIDAEALHIPMRQIPQQLGKLDPESLVVVHCHHGARSAQVVGFLRSQGFTKATNLAGGIDAWSAVVDPSVPRY